MKVMCIDDRPPLFSSAIMPKYGEIVTASQCTCHYDCYIIAEYLFTIQGYPQSIPKKRFIPLSDIDETELIKERELVNA